MTETAFQVWLFANEHLILLLVLVHENNLKGKMQNATEPLQLASQTVVHFSNLI